MSGDIVVCPSWGEDTGVWLGDAISVLNVLQCKGQTVDSLHLLTPWGQALGRSYAADSRSEEWKKTGSMMTPLGHRLILPLSIQSHKFNFLMVKPLFHWGPYYLHP